MATKTNDTGHKSKKIYIVLIILILLAIISGAIINHYKKILEDERIYKGISIENIDIGGLTKKQGLEKIKDEKEIEIDDKNMELAYEEFNYKINIRDLDFQYDYDKAINQAYEIARKGKGLDRLKEIKELEKNKNINIELESSFNEDKAETLISQMQKDIDVAMVEAQFDFNGGNFIITDEIRGRYVYVDKIIELINNNVYDLNVIEIPVEPVIPNITRGQLERINGVIGEFTTSFKTSTAERKENIRISSKAIKDVGVIMPGETVSFNQATGPRSISNGYQGATVIEEGEFTDGVGGGVCQTSTTLYNALLRADLSVVARGPHSIPIRYVPFGQDAAVAYDYLDLKYRNDFDFPIYIDYIYTGNSITFKIYGDKNIKNYDVKIDSETVDTETYEVERINDKTLAKGKEEVVQQGRNGYKVNTYKSIIKDGKVTERNMITKDYYKPRNGIIRVGSKEENGIPPETNTTEDESSSNQE